MIGTNHKQFKKNIIEDYIKQVPYVHLVFSQVSPLPVLLSESTVANSVKGGTAVVSRSFSVKSLLNYAIAASKLTSAPAGIDGTVVIAGNTYYYRNLLGADVTPYDALYLLIADIRTTAEFTFNIVSVVISTEATPATMNDTNTSIVVQYAHSSTQTIPLDDGIDETPYYLLINL